MSIRTKSIVAAALLVAGSVIAAPLLPGSRSVVIRGTLSVVQEDDFEHSRTARVHTIVDEESGEPFTLRFTGTPDRRLRTGARVLARGQVIGRELHLASLDADSIEILAPADAPAMEARRAVVLVTNFSDSAVSC